MWISGEVLAKQLASLGAKLILSARNEAELERVKKQLTGVSIYLKLQEAFHSLLVLSYSWHEVGTSTGKHAPDEVKILPLDLASGEDSLREAVEKAESFFFGAGVDYMIHNAAYERPVSRYF